MVTFEEAVAILNRISYRPSWLICTRETYPDMWEMWVTFETIDATDGVPVSMETRCWTLYPTMDEQDIIGAAFLMFKQAEEHEMMEFFKLDGIGIFNPHITIAAHKLAYRESFAPEKARDPSLVPA